MKRMEKPLTNKIAPRAVLPLFFTSVMPAEYAKYPGTKGSTHGEKKEINPAMSETPRANNKFPDKT